VPPVSDGSGQDRYCARRARFCSAIKDGKRTTPQGDPLVVEFLIDDAHAGLDAEYPEILGRELDPRDGFASDCVLGQPVRASAPQRVDQFYRRVDDPAADSQQDQPYEIVDLPPEIGSSQLHRLRSIEKGSFQEYDDRYCSQQQGDQLKHNAFSFFYDIAPASTDLRWSQ
jgi:hypothetical protein